MICSHSCYRMNTLVKFAIMSIAIGKSVSFCPAGKEPIPCEDQVDWVKNQVINNIASIESAAQVCEVIEPLWWEIVDHLMAHEIIQFDFNLPIALGDCQAVLSNYVIPAIATLPPIEDISVGDVCDNIPPALAEITIDYLIGKGLIALNQVCIL